MPTNLAYILVFLSSFPIYSKGLECFVCSYLEMYKIHGFNQHCTDKIHNCETLRDAAYSTLLIAEERAGIKLPAEEQAKHLDKAEAKLRETYGASARVPCVKFKANEVQGTHEIIRKCQAVYAPHLKFLDDCRYEIEDYSICTCRTNKCNNYSWYNPNQGRGHAPAPISTYQGRDAPNRIDTNQRRSLPYAVMSSSTGQRATFMVVNIAVFISINQNVNKS